MEPTQDEVYDMSEGDTKIIRCLGRGMPTPTITLTHEVDGREEIISKSHSSIEFPLIVDTSSQKFYCKANNSIVHPLPSGKVEHVTTVQSVTVNAVHDEKFKNEG